MEKSQSLYIGKTPWHISFVGVDRATGAILHEEADKPIMGNPQERADAMADALGLELKHKIVKNGEFNPN